ncbi:signal peptidase I [Alteribacter natronophilus]|uniref:signal peptidase I n=1 Tax=Alteribacter natronophilus TaxID=2583810 RepID=UPI00110E073D|nr:signal peptidase I [Alteribacter natronophilus]TMW70994.1 signal peptidase I [Alteribacter natronophilus]
MSTSEKLVHNVSSWAKAIFISLFIAILVTVFIVQPYTVDGSSMEPSLAGLGTEESGDRVMALKTPYVFGSAPELGEIVIVDSRVDRERTLKDVFLESPFLSFFNKDEHPANHKWIKRVIGEPGDRIEIRRGILYLNGEALDEDYLKGGMQQDFPEITVPDDAIFVMGDNRNGSRDSRNVGPVPVENVIGKVVLRYYPLDRIGGL